MGNRIRYNTQRYFSGGSRLHTSLSLQGLLPNLFSSISSTDLPKDKPIGLELVDSFKGKGGLSWPISFNLVQIDRFSSYSR